MAHVPLARLLVITTHRMLYLKSQQNPFKQDSRILEI